MSLSLICTPSSHLNLILIYPLNSPCHSFTSCYPSVTRLLLILSCYSLSLILSCISYSSQSQSSSEFNHATSVYYLSSSLLLHCTPFSYLSLTDSSLTHSHSFYFTPPSWLLLHPDDIFTQSINSYSFTLLITPCRFISSTHLLHSTYHWFTYHSLLHLMHIPIEFTSHLHIHIQSISCPLPHSVYPYSVTTCIHLHQCIQFIYQFIQSNSCTFHRITSPYSSSDYSYSFSCTCTIYFTIIFLSLHIINSIQSTHSFTLLHLIQFNLLHYHIPYLCLIITV